MDQPPNLDMVYMAVSALYNNPDSTEKEKASRWLGDLQKSIYSWKVADEMLQQKRDIESCYFAAQTMRSKIQLSFHELPYEAHTSLKDSLIEHINQINDCTNTIIVTQLCLAIADLALQMPTWHKPALDLINRFSQAHIWPLLEILTVLPEELESPVVRLGTNRRLELLEDFKSCAPTILELLGACITSSGDNVQVNVKVLRCFSSWILIQAFTLPDIADNVVIRYAFTILQNQKSVTSLHEAATDCICILLQCLEDNNNQQNLEQTLFSGVVSLEEPYHLSVAREDQEKSINYCRIFTELAESFLEKIVANTSEKHHHYAIKILDLVLICAGHHEYEVAEITFNLWFRLSEDLYHRNSKCLTDIFRPYIERLITALCRHCQMEPDETELLKDGDEFKDFRNKVSDLIKDVVFIVGSSNCFRQMFMNLQAPGVTWDSSEASLFIMQAVAKNILPEENEIVPKVVEAILNLPEETHVAVRYTSVQLLGELCEWIEEHPASIEPVVNFLVYNLQQSGVASAAASALQSICVTCHGHMMTQLPILLQLMQRIDTLKVTNHGVIGIMRGVAAVIGCLDHSQLRLVLRELCLLQVTPLCELIEQDVIPFRGAKSDPVLWLDRLASVFRYISVRNRSEESNPCRDIVAEVWPVLSNTFTKYQADSRIMERCCRCVRFMIRCISTHGIFLLSSLVTQIIEIYSMHRHPCFLYLGSILVDEFACENDCIQGLLDMLQAFITPTFLVLKEENGLRNHPDMIDDFFRLCTRFLQRSPLPFLQCSALQSIFQCALLSCSLDHTEANMSIMRFFCDLIDSGKSDKQPDYELRKSLVNNIIQENGQQLISNLIRAAVFDLHSYMLANVTEVISELIYVDRDSVSMWLENAIHMLPNQGTGGFITATHKQLADFHSKVMSSTSHKSVTSALKEFARLYR